MYQTITILVSTEAAQGVLPTRRGAACRSHRVVMHLDDGASQGGRVVRAEPQPGPLIGHHFAQPLHVRHDDGSIGEEGLDGGVSEGAPIRDGTSTASARSRPDQGSSTCPAKTTAPARSGSTARSCSRRRKPSFPVKTEP